MRFAAIGECMIELKQRDPASFSLAYGGDTLNCATYLARLVRGRGIDVEYVTALGDDPYSDAMLETWKAEGIDTESVPRLSGMLPGLYIIRTDEQGERSFFYYRSQSAARLLLRDGRAEALRRSLAGVDILYVSGITLSIFDDKQREALMRIFETVREAGGGVAFDGNYRPRGWSAPDEARHWYDRVLEVATIALPTFDDEKALFGDAGPEATVQRLRQAGIGEIVVKLGPDGVLLAHGDTMRKVPTERVQAVDTTAAGDSFNGAYLAARLLGKSPREAAEAGNRLAGAKVRHHGAIMPAAAMPDLGV